MHASELKIPQELIEDNPEMPKQPKRGVGRLPGYKNKINKDSIKKLELKGFDPIDKLIECHKKITKEIERQENLQFEKDLFAEQGLNKRTHYSAMAHAQLLAAEQKLLMDLVPYRYAKVPVDLNVNNNEALPPIMISLTKKGDTYEIDPSENVDINDMETLAYKGDNESGS